MPDTKRDVDTIQISVRHVDRELWDQLRVESIKRHMPLHELVNELLRERFGGKGAGTGA